MVGGSYFWAVLLAGRGLGKGSTLCAARLLQITAIKTVDHEPTVLCFFKKWKLVVNVDLRGEARKRQSITVSSTACASLGVSLFDAVLLV